MRNANRILPWIAAGGIYFWWMVMEGFSEEVIPKLRAARSSWCLVCMEGMKGNKTEWARVVSGHNKHGFSGFESCPAMTWWVVDLVQAYLPFSCASVSPSGRVPEAVGCSFLTFSSSPELTYTERFPAPGSASLLFSAWGSSPAQPNTDSPSYGSPRKLIHRRGARTFPQVLIPELPLISRWCWLLPFHPLSLFPHL